MERISARDEEGEEEGEGEKIGLYQAMILMTPADTILVERVTIAHTLWQTKSIRIVYNRKTCRFGQFFLP